MTPGYTRVDLSRVCWAFLNDDILKIGFLSPIDEINIVDIGNCDDLTCFFREDSGFTVIDTTADPSFIAFINPTFVEKIEILHSEECSTFDDFIVNLMGITQVKVSTNAGSHVLAFFNEEEANRIIERVTENKETFLNNMDKSNSPKKTLVIGASFQEG